MALNPMTGIIGGFRAALLGQPLDWAGLGAAALVSCAVLGLGILYFRRTERFFADVA